MSKPKQLYKISFNSFGIAYVLADNWDKAAEIIVNFYKGAVTVYKVERIGEEAVKPALDNLFHIQHEQTKP